MSGLQRICDDVWAHQLEDSVYLQLRHGIKPTTLPDADFAAAERHASFARSILARLDAVDASALSGQDLVTHDVLVESMRSTADAPAGFHYSFPVAPYALQTLAAIVPRAFRSFAFDEPSDDARFLSLCADYARTIRQMLQTLREQDERGIRIPRPALPGVRTTVQGLRAGVSAVLTPSKDSLRDAAANLVSGEVLPAYDAILSLLGGDYEGRAPEGVGLGVYDGGREAYERRVRVMTTLDLTPDDVHRTGLDQLERISDEMATVRAEVGFTGTEREFHDALQADRRFYADTPGDVEALYMRCIRRFEPEVDTWFAGLPKAPYGVERLDEALEASLTFGFYEPPTPDKPVGNYRYNGSKLESRSLLTAPSIIYHELIPGHHFHIARQQEDESLPLVRREGFGFGAYVEGWAEYAAHVAGEAGMFDDPYDRYGRLAIERFMSTRLVVDTGMNALGWTLERARDFMREHTLDSDTQIATETLRYSTDMPAQALGYRIGCLKLLELRDSWTGSVKDFHEAVLGCGAVPLTVLQRHLERTR